MDPQILMQINEIYRNEVYAEETLSEVELANINGWVSQLIFEGYDLDQFSDEELYEAYLEDLDEARVDDNKSRLQKEMDRSKRHGSAPHYFPGNLDNQTAARTSDHVKQRGVTKVMAGLPAREMSGAPDLFNYKNRFNEPRPSDGGKRVGPQKTADQYGRFAKNMKNVPPEEKSKTIKAIKKSILKRPKVRVPLPEELDLYDIVSDYLVSEGFCDSYEDADVIMANMSEEWRESIVEEVLQEDEAWRERNFRPMEPYKQEIVQGRHAELAGKTFNALDKLKKLDKKPLKRFRPGLKKRILSTAKSGKTAGRLATRAGESLIRQSHHDEKQKRNKISALKSIAGALEDGEPKNSIRKFTREELDLYNAVSDYLVTEGFCDSYEDADVIMVNMSEHWVDGILDEVTGSGQVRFRKGLPGKSPKKAGMKKTPQQKAAEKLGGLDVDPTTDPQRRARLAKVVLRLS